jgi:drug/metabolite transporter (DMT)-like permease
VSQQQEQRDVSPAPAPPRSTAGVALALVSGVAIGVFFLMLARTRADAGLWPLVAARTASVALFAVLTLFYRPSLRMPRTVTMTAVVGGALDMLANLFYLLASRQGPLALVVTLSSLYPASTVMLARTVLGERLSGRQWAGVVCALIATVTIVTATR